jgi:hypothetical protein
MRGYYTACDFNKALSSWINRQTKNARYLSGSSKRRLSLIAMVVGIGGIAVAWSFVRAPAPAVFPSETQRLPGMNDLLGELDSPDPARRLGYRGTDGV